MNDILAATLSIGPFQTSLYVRDEEGAFHRFHVVPDASMAAHGRCADDLDFLVEAAQLLSTIGLEPDGGWQMEHVGRCDQYTATLREVRR